MGDTIILILQAIFTQKPTTEIIAFALVTFGVILLLSIVLRKLYRRKPSTKDRDEK